MKQSAESFVLITSLVRLVVIFGVFLVNLISLFKLLFAHKNYCVHRVTICLIILCNLIHLCTWLPYLFFSFQETKWPILSAKEHCIIQHSVISQLMTILLAILTVRKLYDCLSPSNARIFSYSAILAWIIPQMLYLGTVEIMNTSNYHLDRLMLLPNDNTSDIGFMLCIHRLRSSVVAHLSWHYVVLVIPLSASIFLCSVTKALKKSNSKLKESNCHCGPDLVISLSLYFNLMWLLILRPVIVLQTLIMSKDNNNNINTNDNTPTYLDFGTYLVLIFSSIFAPFSNIGGFKKDKYNNNSERIQKYDKRFKNYDEFIENGCLEDKYNKDKILNNGLKLGVVRLVQLNNKTSKDSDQSDFNQLRVIVITIKISLVDSMITLNRRVLKIRLMLITFITLIISWHLSEAKSFLHQNQKRGLLELGCYGEPDYVAMGKLERLCEDCYDLYKSVDIIVGCRKNCFRNQVLPKCVVALQLEDKEEDIKKLVNILNI